MNATQSKIHNRGGFSLIELLVSIAVLSLIMLMVFQMLERTQATWKKSRDSVAEYKDARVGFEAITRRLSQATLAPFWSYTKTDSSATAVANKFDRNSDLHFVSGLASDIMLTPPSNSGKRVTHCMFFQAPTGYSEAASATTVGTLKYGNFPNLLNAWGYFVEFGTDVADRPAFINTLDNAPRVRARYRLMEYCQPTEGLQIYAENLRDPNKKTLAPSALYRWFLNNGVYGCNCANNYPSNSSGSDNLDGKTLRLVAENIVALVILPSESQAKEYRYKLSPNYYYDSRAWQNSNGSKAGGAQETEKMRHALPPIVEVIMVAVDEADFNRYALNRKIDTIAGISNCDFTNNLFLTANKFDEDLATLQKTLSSLEPEIKHRVFRASVRLREAKWGGFVKATGTN